MPSPCGRSRLGRLAEVALDAGRAGDERVEAALAVGGVHDLVHLVDVLLGLREVAGHDDREDGGVAVGRDQRLVAALVVAGDAVDDAGAERRDLACRASTAARKAGSFTVAVCERTTTTSLAFCGMSIFCARSSWPVLESGLPRKLYCAVRLPGSTSAMMAPAASSASTQSATVSHGRLAEPRASVVVESLMVSPPETAPPGAEAGV